MELNPVTGFGVTAQTTIEVSSDALRVKASGIGSNQLASDAVTTVKILDSSITEAKLDAALQSKVNGVAIYSFDVTIPSAQVLTLATTPVTLVSAPGAGLKIVPISIQASIDFNSVAYTVADEVDIYAGGNKPCFILPNEFLYSTVSKTVNAALLATNITATDTQYVANQPLTIWAEAGGSDPLSGDSNIRIQGLYRII